MSQRSKLTQRRSLDAMKKEMGISGLEKFRRSILTPELRENMGLTPEDELRFAAVAELHILGLPVEVAEALVFSGALGSASELAALNPDEVQQVLAEAPVKRLLPAQLQITHELIEQWLERITPLTGEEDPSARGAMAEDQEESMASDEDASLVEEDLILDRQDLKELLNAYQEQCRHAEAAVQSLSRTGTGQIEASTVRQALLDLQGDLSDIIDRLTASDKGGFVAMDEDSSEALEDEGMEPAKDIQALEAELRGVELKMEALRRLAESGDEDRSAAMAMEEVEGDVESPLSGE
jgi:hypothetical protein